MKIQLTVFGLLAVLMSSCKQEKEADMAISEAAAKTASTELLANATLSGANVLAFGPGNVLFIGDSKGGMIHAVTTTAEKMEDAVPYNMEGFDVTLAQKLDIATRDVVINDMKIHPVSQEAYVSIKLGHQPEAKSVVAIVHPVTKTIRFLAVTEDNSSSIALSDPASAELVFWEETPATALSITDIDYNDGYIYVAGLTNSEFASTLRKIAYPFTADQEAVNSIEIYHAVHAQTETRAPIRTMLFDEVDGESVLLASYTCTPLVSIPTDRIQAGADIKGKTIAELGYGNAPIDMLTVTTQEMDGSLTKNLLVTHKNRGGTMVPFASVVAGSKGNGMAGQQQMFASGLEGIQQIPTANVMQIDMQNPQMLGVLRRNIETGEIDLVSELSGVYLRLSDFISEYDFPDYQYPESQAFTKQYHDMAKQMEGYPNLVSEKMDR
ncbi:MAG: hypothetical protein AAF717_08565 [Bacteroidota bacterium]